MQQILIKLALIFLFAIQIKLVIKPTMKQGIRINMLYIYIYI